MGCLNPGGHNHWFGNIHLSGPCNRKCYFCIGQHMMDLDQENTLDQWPLDGIEEFADECAQRSVQWVYLTGTNTDPMLYRHRGPLLDWLRSRLPGVSVGVRTNGVRLAGISEFDGGSFTVASCSSVINQKMMGGPAVDLERLRQATFGLPFKINVPLGRANQDDWLQTVRRCGQVGFDRVNIRELYGQEHIGCPFTEPDGHIYGMPYREFFGVQVLYWDVHWVEVESVNLYANGRVSLDYPITRGHSENGEVHPQDKFEGHQRRRPQWQKLTVSTT